jgi:hypothetical protein
MATVTIQAKVETAPLAERGKRAKARLAAIAAAKPASSHGIRVEPASDALRRVLKHPRAGAFRSSGSMVWPNDRFTHKRLLDGDIKRVEEEKKADKPATSAATSQT